MITVKPSAFSKDFSARMGSFSASFEKHHASLLMHGFAHLPWEDVSAISQLQLPSSCAQICVVGMGGASLGAKALIEALQSTDTQTHPKVIFLDNIDPDFVSQKLAQCDAKKTLFLLISKSGETIEVLSLSQILLHHGIPKKHFIVITDNRESSLGKLAALHKLFVFPSSESIPGRFSALSIVGLLPSLLAGLSIKKILAGAASANVEEAYRLACMQYLNFKEGRKTVALFSYSEALNTFADWYIQLLAESIGKSHEIGITPIKAIGVKDQHSQLQLFLDGPDDKFYIFLKPQKTKKDFTISGKTYTLGKLFDAEYEGVIAAYKERKKNFSELTVPEITPEILGELFFFFELSVGFLGILLNVPIDTQPAVELSKKKTLHILG